MFKIFLVPNCTEFNQAIEEGSEKGIYEFVPSRSNERYFSANLHDLNDTLSCTKLINSISHLPNFVQTLEPVTELPAGVQIDDSDSWKTWEDTLLATALNQNSDFTIPEIKKIKIVNIKHQVWYNVQIFRKNVSFCIKKLARKNLS